MYKISIRTDIINLFLGICCHFQSTMQNCDISFTDALRSAAQRQNKSVLILSLKMINTYLKK